MPVGTRYLLGDGSVSGALLLPALVNLGEIIVLISSLEDIGGTLVLPHCPASLHLLLQASTSIAIKNENDTTFLGDVAHAEELAKVALHKLFFLKFVEDSLPHAVANVLLGVKDATKELEHGTGQFFICHPGEKALLVKFIALIELIRNNESAILAIYQKV